MAKTEILKDELFAVHSYKFLVESVTKLEEQGVPKESQWETLKEVKDQLDGFAKEKLIQSLRKNPDLEEVAI